MDLQKIYSQVNFLILALEKNNYYEESKILKNALYSGITSGEIFDNLKECLKEIKKIKIFKNDCKMILREINRI